MSVTAMAAPGLPGGASVVVQPGRDFGHAAPMGCSVVAAPGGLVPSGPSLVVAPAGGASFVTQAAPDRPFPSRPRAQTAHAPSAQPQIIRQATTLAGRPRAASDMVVMMAPPVVAAPPPAPAPAMSAVCPGQGMMSDLLDQVIMPGDILYSKGGGMGLGAAGGLMGHVSIAVASPTRIIRGTPEALRFGPVWPGNNVSELWRVKTVESTRYERCGLYQTETLLYVDPLTRRLRMVGDLTDYAKHQVLGVGEWEVPVEIWQSPPELRAMVNQSIVQQVVNEMMMTSRNWNATTAVRALFFSTSAVEPIGTMTDVQDAWHQGPICTSVAITFWQRYICKMAEMSGGRRNANDLISRYIPLLADRTLPGDLVNALRNTGWTKLSNVYAGARALTATAVPVQQPTPVSPIQAHRAVAPQVMAHQPSFVFQPCQVPMGIPMAYH
mmetsp:Transcript_32747/g.59854  ORF Transcript_32747/g.59854 Transcript_32747/m.59854 type:complete len:439 (-) Transcript_32747:116-1432(-)